MITQKQMLLTACEQNSNQKMYIEYLEQNYEYLKQERDFEKTLLLRKDEEIQQLKAELSQSRELLKQRKEFQDQELVQQIELLRKQNQEQKELLKQYYVHNCYDVISQENHQSNKLWMCMVIAIYISRAERRERREVSRENPPRRIFERCLGGSVRRD